MQIFGMSQSPVPHRLLFALHFDPVALSRCSIALVEIQISGKTDQKSIASVSQHALVVAPVDVLTGRVVEADRLPVVDRIVLVFRVLGVFIDLSSGLTILPGARFRSHPHSSHGLRVHRNTVRAPFQGGPKSQTSFPWTEMCLTFQDSPCVLWTVRF